MERLSPNNFFNYFINHPRSEYLDCDQHSRALVFSIFVGIITLYIAQLVAKCRERKFQIHNDLDDSLSDRIVQSVERAISPRKSQNEAEDSFRSLSSSSDSDFWVLGDYMEENEDDDLGLFFALEASCQDQESQIKPRSDEGEQLTDEEKASYFAYGSNMMRSRLEERVGKVDLVGRAVLEDYEFRFSKWSAADRSGKANIHSVEGEQVEGVLYELTLAQIKKLDQYEGHPTHYLRQTVNVLTNGEICEAITYIAQANMVRESLQPTEEYFDFVYKVAVENKLDSNALNTILQCKPKNDPIIPKA